MVSWNGATEMDYSAYRMPTNKTELLTAVDRFGLGNRVAYMGDSITASAWGPSKENKGNSYPLYAELLSGGKILSVRNAAIGGQKAAEMDARFMDDIAPYKPNIVVIMAGRNDVPVTAFSSFKASMISMVTKTRSIGAVPVLGTIPPKSNDAPARTTTIKFNAWIKSYAVREGIVLLDFYKLLVDPTNGNYIAAYDSDGTHPTTAGYKAMGQLTSDVLTPIIRPHYPYLSVDNADTFNMFYTGTPNAVLLTDTNADGIPDNWSAYGGSSGYAHALVTDANIPGKMMQITQTANGSVRILAHNNIDVAGGAYTGGDTLAFSGVLTSDGGVSVQLRIKVTGSSGTLDYYAANYTAAITRGLFYQEIFCPVGTTTIQIDFVVGAGTGVVSIGQPTLVNLTALGI